MSVVAHILHGILTIWDKGGRETRKKVVVAAVATAATIVAAVALWRQWRRRSERLWKPTQRILCKFARDCITPVPKIYQVVDDLVSDMQASLASNHTANLNMLVSYVASIPNGGKDEKGLYNGVNLRGANFLILCARLGGKNKNLSDLCREEISFPSNVMLGTNQELFDFIALELAKFVSAEPENDNDVPTNQKKLGFTLSYPVDQGAASPGPGTAIKWKSFSADDMVGKELVNDINRSLEKHVVNFRVYAFVDDTIGNLAGGRYYNRETVASVTLGMTTKAAYVEPAHAVARWQGLSPNSEEIVSSHEIISTEWGNFNSIHFPLTEFDSRLDAESFNPGSQVWQLLFFLEHISYLGEVVRRILLKMAQETTLFGDYVPSKLNTPYILRYYITNDVLVKGIRFVNYVGSDGGQSVALRLAGTTITVEGGLYEHFRVFRNYLNSSVWEMLGNDLSDNVNIEHSHGGSGTGIMMRIHVPSNVPMQSTPFKGMEFEADEIAYDFYNEYGRKAGFSIRKDKKYVVNEFIAEHNHYLHLASTVHMMPSQRKVAATHAIEIDLAHESGLRLKQSYELLSKQVGGYDNLGFTKQDHKNYLRTKR
ncbi:putative hexokinase-like 2 protein [Castanea sativa]|uniref:putative hexokinase-like 2 protein n=1 Tax=Castanea sativa TaxID=21020 RepID=UPI003F649C5B